MAKPRFVRNTRGMIATRSQIGNMDNGQTPKGTVLHACGGYNCRHRWRPVNPLWFTPEEWARHTDQPYPADLMAKRAERTKREEARRMAAKNGYAVSPLGNLEPTEPEFWTTENRLRRSTMYTPEAEKDIAFIQGIYDKATRDPEAVRAEVIALLNDPGFTGGLAPDGTPNLSDRDAAIRARVMTEEGVNQLGLVKVPNVDPKDNWLWPVKYREHMGMDQDTENVAIHHLMGSRLVESDPEFRRLANVIDNLDTTAYTVDDIDKFTLPHTIADDILDQRSHNRVAFHSIMNRPDAALYPTPYGREFFEERGLFDDEPDRIFRIGPDLTGTLHGAPVFDQIKIGTKGDSIRADWVDLDIVNARTRHFEDLSDPSISDAEWIDRAIASNQRFREARMNSVRKLGSKLWVPDEDTDFANIILSPARHGNALAYEASIKTRVKSDWMDYIHGALPIPPEDARGPGAGSDTLGGELFDQAFFAAKVPGEPNSFSRGKLWAEIHDFRNLDSFGIKVKTPREIEEYNKQVPELWERFTGTPYEEDRKLFDAAREETYSKRADYLRSIGTSTGSFPTLSLTDKTQVSDLRRSIQNYAKIYKQDLEIAEAWIDVQKKRKAGGYAAVREQYFDLLGDKVEQSWNFGSFDKDEREDLDDFVEIHAGVRTDPKKWILDTYRESIRGAYRKTQDEGHSTYSVEAIFAETMFDKHGIRYEELPNIPMLSVGVDYIQDDVEDHIIGQALTTRYALQKNSIAGQIGDDFLLKWGKKGHHWGSADEFNGTAKHAAFGSGAKYSPLVEYRDKSKRLAGIYRPRRGETTNAIGAERYYVYAQERLKKMHPVDYYWRGQSIDMEVAQQLIDERDLQATEKTLQTIPLTGATAITTIPSVGRKYSASGWTANTGGAGEKMSVLFKAHRTGYADKSIGFYHPNDKMKWRQWGVGDEEDKPFFEALTGAPYFEIESVEIEPAWSELEGISREQAIQKGNTRLVITGRFVESLDVMDQKKRLFEQRTREAE